MEQTLFWSTFLLPPINIRIRGPKTAKFGKNMHFWTFWAKYLPFWSILSYGRPNNNGNEVPSWFSEIWVPELLLPLKIIRMFGPKTANFAPCIMHSCAHIDRPCRLIWCSVGWLVGDCGARAVSRKAPIFFIIIIIVADIIVAADLSLVRIIRWTSLQSQVTIIIMINITLTVLVIGTYPVN